LAADGATSNIFPQGIVSRARRGVGVRSLHVTDRSAQISRSGSGIIRREGFARDLRGSRKLPRSVQCQGKASNSSRGDGRDCDVADNVENGHRGDASLCKYGVVAGISKVDWKLIIISLTCWLTRWTGARRDAGHHTGRFTGRKARGCTSTRD
jgi:hypothetical protein